MLRPRCLVPQRFFRFSLGDFSSTSTGTLPGTRRDETGGDTGVGDRLEYSGYSIEIVAFGVGGEREQSVLWHHLVIRKDKHAHTEKTNI